MPSGVQPNVIAALPEFWLGSSLQCSKNDGGLTLADRCLEKQQVLQRRRGVNRQMREISALRLHGAPFREPDLQFQIPKSEGHIMKDDSTATV
jgi:hypothetical protein